MRPLAVDGAGFFCFFFKKFYRELFFVFLFLMEKCFYKTFYLIFFILDETVFSLKLFSIFSQNFLF